MWFSYQNILKSNLFSLLQLQFFLPCSSALFVSCLILKTWGVSRVVQHMIAQHWAMILPVLLILSCFWSFCNLNFVSVFHHPEESPNASFWCKVNYIAKIRDETCLNKSLPRPPPPANSNLFYLECLNCLAILANIPFIIILYGMSPYLLLIS